MAINNIISDSYQIKYDNMWTHLIQQKKSRLREFVTVKEASGKMFMLDQMGITSFDEKTTRDITRVVEPVDAPTANRSLTPRWFTKTHGFDEFDASQLGDQSVPLTEMAQAFGMAAGRQMDKVIVGEPGDALDGDWGILGNAYGGDAGLTAIPFDTNNVIDGSAGMSVALLAQAVGLMMTSEAYGQGIEEGDIACIAMRGKDIATLLDPAGGLTTYDQHEIRKVLASQNGFVDILGVRVVLNNNVPVHSTSTVARLPMWMRSQVVLGVWVDQKLRLSIRDDLEEVIQMRAKFGCNATRRDENGCFAIDVVA